MMGLTTATGTSNNLAALSKDATRSVAVRAIRRQDKDHDTSDKKSRKHRKIMAGTIGALSGAAALQSAFGKKAEAEPMTKIPPMFSDDERVHCESDSELSASLEGAVIFSGNGNRELAEKIAAKLGIQLGNLKLTKFADGEISLKFLDSLRGKDVYLIQPTAPPVNENLMELLLMISTCRRSSAKKITAVVPYYGYARQDRKLSSRVPISAADVARMIEAMGVDRVMCVDLHCGQIQGFFGPRVPVDNLEAQKVGLQYFSEKDLSNPVIVSPDAGGVYRARKFQENLAQIDKSKQFGLAMLIKQRSGPNAIDKMELVGSVNGADVIIVDDMIDTAGTLCEAAKLVRQHGAKRIFCFAIHGLFSNPAVKRLENSVLEEVVVTDSINIHQEALNCPRITQLSIDGLLAEAIHRVHMKESIHNVFYDSPEEKKSRTKKH